MSPRLALPEHSFQASKDGPGLEAVRRWDAKGEGSWPQRTVDGRGRVTDLAGTLSRHDLEMRTSYSVARLGGAGQSPST